MYSFEIKALLNSENGGGGEGGCIVSVRKIYSDINCICIYLIVCVRSILYFLLAETYADTIQGKWQALVK